MSGPENRPPSPFGRARYGGVGYQGNACLKVFRKLFGLNKQCRFFLEIQNTEIQEMHINTKGHKVTCWSMQMKITPAAMGEKYANSKSSIKM